MNERAQLGQQGERAVVEYLQKKKFKVLATNYSTRLGEIDIIAQYQDLLVFVEVKTRTNPQFEISSVVTHSKQRKIIAATKGYMLEHRVSNKICRFDVATVTFYNQTYAIEYIESAFYGE